MGLKNYWLSIILIFSFTAINAHTDFNYEPVIKTTISSIPDIGIVIYSNDPETVWNAFRLANYALDQQDKVAVFLLGKGVEAEQLKSDLFDIKDQMVQFTTNGGQIMSCGTCLDLRNQQESALCPISSMSDLYDLIKQSKKTLTF
jgi:sulfur relay (sulfurtransferase) complex TusBCD TusD component (DsrE family)